MNFKRFKKKRYIYYFERQDLKLGTLGTGIQNQCVEKLSSTELVPGTKKAADCCSKT